MYMCIYLVCTDDIYVYSCEQANPQGPCIDFEQKGRVKVNAVATFKTYWTNKYFSLSCMENKG